MGLVKKSALQIKVKGRMKHGTNKQKLMEQELFATGNWADNVLIGEYDNLDPITPSYIEY